MAKSDFVGFVRTVDGDIMLDLYRDGRFVMPFPVGDFYSAYSPKQRGVLPLENLRVTRSLKQSMKHYHVTFDTAFDEVLRKCAGRNAKGDWIDTRLAATYLALHEMGYAHSVETWDSAGGLAGGLFVVNLGGLVSGESMFHVGRDASKTALVRLVERLRESPGPILFDTQWQTPHLASLGVIRMPRSQYLALLPGVTALPNVL